MLIGFSVEAERRRDELNLFLRLQRKTSNVPPEHPAPSSKSPVAEQPHVGNYRLLKTVGKGNFAKVKLARHTPTGRQVSLHSQDDFTNRWILTGFTFIPPISMWTAAWFWPLPVPLRHTRRLVAPSRLRFPPPSLRADWSDSFSGRSGAESF